MKFFFTKTTQIFLLSLLISPVILNAQVSITNETQAIIEEIQKDYIYNESNKTKVSEQILEAYAIAEINGKIYLNMQGYANSDFNKSEIESKGIIVSTRTGKLLSIRVPLNYISEITNLSGIKYLEFPANMQPELYDLVKDVRADSSHWGIDLPQRYTGEGVIVGIIDWGFDYTQPIFYDSALENNRIIAVWDHYRKSGPAPSKYGYGTEFNTTDDILAAEHDTAYGSIYETHGTHVAGIAGGGGAGIGMLGVAYNCEFLLVQPNWKTGNFLDCVDWIYNKAKKEGKRVVINMSFGSYHYGTLDTNNFYHETAKEYTRKGVVMVGSAGNNGESEMHIDKKFHNDEITTWVNAYPVHTSFPNYWGQRIIAWGQEGKDFSCAIDIYQGTNRVYEGEYFSTKNTKSKKISVLNDKVQINIVAEKSHPMNDKPTMSLRIKKEIDAYKIVLRAKAKDGTVHFWNVIEQNGGTSNTGKEFLSFLPDWVAGTDSFTVSDPGATPYIITVAAHSPQTTNADTLVPGEIAYFSSRGPTIDGLMKPDVSAPGYQILSSISSATTQAYTKETSVTFKGKEYDFARFSGTSMSSPATTGVVALLLEANPELSAMQIKKILMNTARQDFKTGILPQNGNTTWGTGKVDSYIALKSSIDIRGDFYKNGNHYVYPNPVNRILYYQGSKPDGLYETEVYDMLGKQVFKGEVGALQGIDFSEKLDGIYIIRIFDGDWSVQRVVVNNHF